MQRFDGRSANAVVEVALDIAAWTPQGATIASVDVLIEVWEHSSAPDADPSATLSGPASTQGTVILQRVQSGVVGCTYVLTFRATFDDGSTDEEQVLQSVVRYVPK